MDVSSLLLPSNLGQALTLAGLGLSLGEVQGFEALEAGLFGRLAIVAHRSHQAKKPRTMTTFSFKICKSA